MYLAEAAGMSPREAAEEYFSSDLCRKEPETAILRSFADLEQLAESVGRSAPRPRRYSLGGSRPSPAAEGYARRLVEIVERLGPALDEAIRRHLTGWSLGRLGAVERALLRVSAAEMLGCLDVPGAVVIDEAVEIAKRYCAEESYSFVNGVLDALLQESLASGARTSPGEAAPGQD